MNSTPAKILPAKILIVDDQPANLTLLGNVLNAAGYRVFPVSSGIQALKLLERHVPDLMLLDIRMPGMDGFELLGQIQNLPQCAGIPILFISADDALDSKVRAFELGAVDYLNKPFQAREVLARVGTHLRLHSLQKQLEQQILALEQANQTIHELSIRDELTQLHNRRYFNSQALELLKSLEQENAKVAVVMADIDRFKSINDTFSHPIGDVVLQQVAQILASYSQKADHSRENNLLARFGGEEFALLLPHTSLEGAVQLCENIRQGVEQFSWDEIRPELRVTISLGVASNPPYTLSSLLSWADECLYQAKNRGRNRVYAQRVL